MDIRRQTAYAENTRRLLRETLAAHPEALDQPFETTAQHKTVGQLVAHLIGAEQRWTQGRLYGEPRPPRYEDEAAGTLDGLFADWDRVRAHTLTFAARADAAGLARVITTELPQWSETVTLTAEEVLLHICNHQTWHLGQISMALQRLGVDPPNFDYVFLREREAPQEEGTADYVVNVEAVVYDGDRYLMAFRSEQEAHAPRTLALPGGKVENVTDMESVLEETARREVGEEVGIEVTDFQYIKSNVFGDTSPCINVVFLCRYVSGLPAALDPAEVSAVQWMTLAEALAHPKTPPWIARSLTRADQMRRLPPEGD